MSSVDEERTARHGAVLVCRNCGWRITAKSDGSYVHTLSQEADCGLRAEMKE